MAIRTPDYRLRVFVSSTLHELAEERKAVRQAIVKLRLSPVMFEGGSRPHPAQDLYQSYLSQSQIFIGIYWQSYGWIGPGMAVSGLEDEYNRSARLPRLIYIKDPAPKREPGLAEMLNRIRNDNTTTYSYFTTAAQLKELVQNDLALLLTERFEANDHLEQPGGAASTHPLTNVPIPRNQLIDREKELTDTFNLLQEDDAALITLTGPGGTGKSRLAIQIGSLMLEYFPDGVYLVKLEALRDPKLLISTIAETFNLHESPGSHPITELLKEFLREKKMLLILDNFEQLVEAAPKVAELLETCPRLKCIVTSRTPLHLRLERELPIPPLSIPELQTSNTSDKPHVLDNLTQYSAVELFIQRSRAVKPDFTVNNANAPAVAEICHRLDGLPLAIELAAARIKMFSPEGLLSRLERRFDLLTSGTRDLPERQRTLRGTIDWSYNLLNDLERMLFRRLSVFNGGFLLETAGTVCDINGDLTPHLDDLLESLVDNNLVILHDEADGEPRFDMLSTIHEYATQRLNESDENDAIHQQYARYMLDFVKRVEPRVRSGERSRWQKVMQQEHGNIRGALDWISKTGKCIEIGQQIVITIGWYWHVGGHILEGELWCKRMLELCNDQTPPPILAGLLCFQGELGWAQGDHDTALASIEKSMELCREYGEPALLADALTFRGMIALATRDLETAAATFQEGLEIYRVNHDLWSEVITLSWLGDVAFFQGEPDRARTMHEESIRLARIQGDPWCIMPALMSSAQIALEAGDLDTAQQYLVEAIKAVRQSGDQWSQAWALIDLGHVALLKNELDQSRSYLYEALTSAKTMGNLRAMVIALAATAALITKRAQGETAKLTLAACLCGATRQYLDTPGLFIWFDTKKIYDDSIMQAQSAMDADLWSTGFNDGCQKPIEQAVALAIQALEG